MFERSALGAAWHSAAQNDVIRIGFCSADMRQSLARANQPDHGDESSGQGYWLSMGCGSRGRWVGGNSAEDLALTLMTSHVPGWVSEMFESKLKSGGRINGNDRF